MKQGQTQTLEVQVLDDGLIRARRIDRKPMTPEDRGEALRVADAMPGITIDDVMRIFPGAKVAQSLIPGQK